jgi:transglutaminase-like putative cysteine protease
MTPERISFQALAGIAACLGLAVLAHVGSLPLWVPALVAACGGARLLQLHRGRSAPPRILMVVMLVIAVSLLFMRFRTFNGLAAGTALLVLMAGLKLLESNGRRDIYIITLIIYFICIAALLESESFWLLAYLVGVCWVTTATVLRWTTRRAAPDWLRSARYAGRILAQAIPLMVVFWLLFPRLATPLWRTPLGGQSAATGLSDSMSPGDITQLAGSDEVAFRVHFAGEPPPAEQRYWRGPVLHDFDGHTWRNSAIGPLQGPRREAHGPAYHYTVKLEPHQHNWIFVLDFPQNWDLPNGHLNGDYTLVQQDAVMRPIDVIATSYPGATSTAPLTPMERQRDTRLPPDRNPRTRHLAEELRAAHPDDMDFVQTILHKFADEPYYYTLTPPKLADDSVDEFLFDTKRGFCGHYASAFAAMARAAGIPTRVVTGYQGGTFNHFADYWIVTQSSAHAWDEIWIERRGWVRIDPTSFIAPQRVEHEVDDAASLNEPLANRWQHRMPWLLEARLRLDALREAWRERILSFNQGSQERLLQALHVPEPSGEKLVLLLAAALAAVLGWITWQVRRELAPRTQDPAARAFQRLGAKLGAIGLPRFPHEGPEDYAARVGAARPDLAAQVGAICRHYAALRYGAPPASRGVAELLAAVRAFRPVRRRDSPASAGT